MWSARESKKGREENTREERKQRKKFEGQIAKIWSRGCEEKKLDKGARNYFDDIQISKNCYLVAEIVNMVDIYLIRRIV